MAATAGASGIRAWLQAQHLTWLTAGRMRAVTIVLLVAAFAVSSVGISGSTPASESGTHTIVVHRVNH